MNDIALEQRLLAAAEPAPVCAQPPAPHAAPESDTPINSPFAAFGLADALLRAIADLGYTCPTPVQARAIPLALPGGTQVAEAPPAFIDLMVSSQTGSGKTAAFLLPLLHTLLQSVPEAAAPQGGERRKPKGKKSQHFEAATPGALVLCPTRELAQQVAQDAIALVKYCRGLRIATIVGGMPYRAQIAALHRANLVVATPGRLLDLQNSRQIVLDQVQFLVVDEADRMLDLGFTDDLAAVHQLTAARRQTMMFSATFAPRIQQLALRVMREGGAQAEKVTIDTPQQKHDNIRQMLYWADSAVHKRKLLDHWLRDTSLEQAIVFASTQTECDALAHDLQQDGFSAVALHGAMNQGLRNRRLGALRSGRVQVLVATDVAARGLDVPGVTHVFNYGLPMKAEDYTHRIGRTGRAGRAGVAVTFAEWRDRRRVFDIEGYSRQPFKPAVIVGLEPAQRPPVRNEGRGARNGKPASREGRRSGFGNAPHEGLREGARRQRLGFARAQRSERRGVAR